MMVTFFRQDGSQMLKQHPVLGCAVKCGDVDARRQCQRYTAIDDTLHKQVVHLAEMDDAQRCCQRGTGRQGIDGISLKVKPQ